MLQNPSKYHANPLSHFLALHNTQANAAHGGHGHHGVVQPHGLPTAALAAAAAAAAASSAGQSSYQMEQQQQQHPQQQQQQLTPAHTQSQINNNNHHQQHHPHQHYPQQQTSTATSHAHLIEAAAAHTSLDVGKSFTIAAILGLQQSAIESQRKDYNNAINLSLNGGGVGGGSDAAIDVADQDNNNSKCYSNYNNNNSQNVNNFNCDSSSNAAPPALVNRYLPTLQQQHGGHSHQRANFAAAVAVAAAASVGAPSALQSLQQLHQHHAQQASLNFQREKLKSESNKKSSLKNKRVRTIFTASQLESLEAEFERQQYMVGPERLYLAHTLQLTEAQVKVWFQNRRIKWRKHHLELTQQRLALIRQGQLPGAATTTSTTQATSAVPASELSNAAATVMSSPSLEDNEDSKQSLSQLRGQLSRAPSESDLSICNDSLDGGDSLLDGSEETA